MHLWSKTAKHHIRPTTCWWIKIIFVQNYSRILQFNLLNFNSKIFVQNPLTGEDSVCVVGECGLDRRSIARHPVRRASSKNAVYLRRLTYTRLAIDDFWQKTGSKMWDDASIASSLCRAATHVSMHRVYRRCHQKPSEQTYIYNCCISRLLMLPHARLSFMHFYPLVTRLSFWVKTD